MKNQSNKFDSVKLYQKNLQKCETTKTSRKEGKRKLKNPRGVYSPRRCHLQVGKLSYWEQQYKRLRTMMGCIKYSKQPANESYSQTQLLKS